MNKSILTTLLTSMLVFNVSVVNAETITPSNESTYIELSDSLQYGPAKLMRLASKDGSIEYKMHLTGKHYNESPREITLNHPASKIVGYSTSPEFCDVGGCGYRFDIEVKVNEFYVDSKKSTGFKIQLQSGDLNYNYFVSKADLVKL